MSSSKFRDYYADLGLKPGASPSAIKAAFYAIARTHHPDKTGTDDSTTFRNAREAYEQLLDPKFRATYDRDYWHSKLYTDGNDAEDKTTGHSRTAQYEAEENARTKSPPPVKPKHRPGQASWDYYYSAPYRAWEKKDAAYRARHPELYEEYAHSPDHKSFFITNHRYYEGANASPYAGKAHGLKVRMTSHPAAKQLCPCRTEYWRVQTGGQDHCIFCMVAHTGGSRCPGCQALACQKCLQEVVELERNVLGGMGVNVQYRGTDG